MQKQRWSTYMHGHAKVLIDYDYDYDHVPVGTTNTMENITTQGIYLRKNRLGRIH